MYFLPKNNALYSRIVHSKTSHRYIATSIILVMISALWFLIPYASLVHKRAYMMSDIQRLREQKRMMDQSSSDIMQLERSITTIKEKIAVHTPKNPSSDTVHDVMLLLVHQAGAHGLAMQTCAIADQKEQAGHLRTTINTDVSGPLEQVLKYLQAIAASTHIVAMHHMTLAHGASSMFTVRCSWDVIVPI